jgi:hypothetical protein
MLMQSLEEEFAGVGGHKFLYNLFPMGPITGPAAMLNCQCRRAHSTHRSAPRIKAE